MLWIGLLFASASIAFEIVILERRPWKIPRSLLPGRFLPVVVAIGLSVMQTGIPGDAAEPEPQGWGAERRVATYRVVRGDTLGLISCRYGIDRRRLEEENGVSSQLEQGYLIKIPLDAWIGHAFGPC